MQQEKQQRKADGRKLTEPEARFQQPLQTENIRRDQCTEHEAEHGDLAVDKTPEMQGGTEPRQVPAQRGKQLRHHPGRIPGARNRDGFSAEDGIDHIVLVHDRDRVQHDKENRHRSEDRKAQQEVYPPVSIGIPLHARPPCHRFSAAQSNHYIQNPLFFQLLFSRVFCLFFSSNSLLFML